MQTNFLQWTFNLWSFNSLAPWNWFLHLSHLWFLSWCFKKCSLKAKRDNFSKLIPQVWQSFCWGDIFQMLEQLRWWLMRLSNWVIYLLLPSFDGKLSTNKKYEPIQINNPIITLVTLSVCLEPIITLVTLSACWEPFQGLLAMILPKIGRIRHYYFFYRREPIFYFWPFLAHENRCEVFYVFFSA